MAYSSNINLPKARAIALKLLIMDQLPVQVVANKCGVHRSTIWRWRCKWEVLNRNVQIDNPNRPNREYSLTNHLSCCYWNIPTLSSHPHNNPRSISEQVVKLVLETRAKLKRCAEVVWHHINSVLETRISLSSVRRILKRHHCFDGARKPRLRPDNPKRPLPNSPGDLVEIDTIHHVNLFSGKRLYYYTVIDLYTRMTYALISEQLRPARSLQAILEAENYFGFKIRLVQSDNGSEFSHYFEQQLTKHNIKLRHTRLGRPNDNAHIERFNRTLQDECIGHYCQSSTTLDNKRQKLKQYLDFYNQDRIHLGLDLRTPKQMLQRL